MISARKARMNSDRANKLKESIINKHVVERFINIISYNIAEASNKGKYSVKFSFEFTGLNEDEIYMISSELRRKGFSVDILPLVSGFDIHW